MSDYQIGEAADILQVSTRTLRHWDAIGLLEPGWRTWSGHRLYTEEDLQLALQILVYREAGVPLKEIAELLAEPGSGTQRLQHQRELLVERIAQLHRMVRAVDQILEEDEMKKKPLSAGEKMEIFGGDWKPEYEQEAEQRWGDTPEWEQSRNTQQKMGREDWERVKAEHDEFITRLIDAAQRGLTPGSGEAAELVEAHRRSISQWYEVSPSKQVLLARMYVADERFNATYQGQAAYLLSLVEAQAAAEGVDLNDVQWD
ncbi:HTH-type transcriptional activator TipA [Corynebacterium occultum]|uniref:HTH-type transcriptional activator TipA n=1 Tax=Corynebacterium occultum TaxID=2675219 RepID=A0A6B8W8J0_9CORY|nr:MerR family transcriptional regulator [Corynebacterium occultum]QGU08257.1 HTH-type transcriptional activator TipA [Corynebacterium occultum]